MEKLQECIEKFIEENQEIIDHPSVDCSEIAEDLVKYLISKNFKAELISFKVKDYNLDIPNLFILEKGKPTAYCYHYVVLVNNKIIDLRNPIFFISFDDFKDQVQELNKDKEIEYTIEN